MAEKLIAALLLVTIALVAGCATVETRGEVSSIPKKLKLPPGPALVWKKSLEDEAKVAKRVDQALAGGLTRGEAVAVALLNNRGLQADFEEIGVSKAELVQAGLFANPTIGALIRFPIHGEDSGTNIELTGRFKASDLWHAPLKREIAEAAYRRVTLEVGRQVLDIRRQAQTAYAQVLYLDQAQTQAKELVQSLNDLARAAERRQRFGYMTQAEVLMAQDAVAGAEIQLAQLKMEESHARSHLARVLGLGSWSGGIKLSKNFLPLPAHLLSTDRAVAHALKTRLDVGIVRARAAEASRRLKLANASVVKEVHLGLNWEKETSGDEVLGPEIEMDLPIFDQNQAMIARTEFLVRRAQKRQLALEGEIREQVLHDLARVRFLKSKLHTMQMRVIPLRQKSLAFHQKWAGRMQVSRVMLIQSKKELYEARLDLTHTLMDLHRALADLEYHLGGQLPN